MFSESVHIGIGIKHGFSCINICQDPREVLKTEAAVFNTSLGTWRMFMHWKTMFDRYYWIKTETICYISRYFLHYFVLPFHRCLANVISTDYAHSRAGQYTSRNGSKSVVLVQSYWKLHNRALTALTAFYAVMLVKACSVENSVVYKLQPLDIWSLQTTLLPYKACKQHCCHMQSANYIAAICSLQTTLLP